LRKYVICLVSLFFCLSIFSQEVHHLKVKKGDIVERDGYWVSREFMEKSVISYEELKLYKKLFSIDETTDILTENLVKLYNSRIDNLEKQITLYKDMESNYDEKYKSLEKEKNKEIGKLKNINTALIITNVIGWSLFVSETTGLSVGLYMKFKL